MLVSRCAVLFCSPPAFNDIVDYMSYMPSSNFSGLPVTVTTPVTNTSGFLVNPADVTDPEKASLAGLSLLDEYLLSVRVGDVCVSWPVLQRPCASAACIPSCRVLRGRFGKGEDEARQCMLYFDCAEAVVGAML